VWRHWILADTNSNCFGVCGYLLIQTTECGGTGYLLIQAQMLIADTNKTVCGDWIIADTNKNEGWVCGYLIQIKLSVNVVDTC
jgi:hypothetical protein